MTIATEAKPLPKSLHTVTAIVRVAEHLERTSPIAAVPPITCAARVAQALTLLGYSVDFDPYGLAAKATAQMEKARQLAAMAQAQARKEAA